MGTGGFLAEPEPSDAVEAKYAADRADDGYVMNLTRVWAQAPAVDDAWTAFAGTAAEAAGLTFRQKGIVVTALAAAMGDAYCSLAWGTRLARASDAPTARAVLDGADEGLDDDERTIAAWARQLVRDPNGTTAADVDALRRAGFDDRAILGLTAYIAARIAFSTVNDVLGAISDAELRAAAPPAVLDAVTYGRAATA